MLDAAAILAAVAASDIDPTLCPACLGQCVEEGMHCCGRPFRDGSCCGNGVHGVEWECAVCDGGRSTRARPERCTQTRDLFDLDADLPF